MFQKLIEYFLFNRYAEIGESLKTLLYEAIQYVTNQCATVPRCLMCILIIVRNAMVPRHLQRIEKELEIHGLQTKRNAHVGA